ncbi:MAG: Hsp33 family molecular chaperone HslO [Alphaproteobacteria bacterium]|nr:Hsp33 family molecular chaperone HslO [Alphaproteobacteria bacterium]
MVELSANDNLLEHDVVMPFMIERSHIRGRFVRLKKSLTEVIKQHQYPHVVSRLLGEMLAMAALVGATLKLEGVVSIQLHGNRPIRLIVADYTSEGHVRGYAKWNEEDADYLKQTQEYDFKALMASGNLMISIDHRQWNDKYQGIVPIEKETLAGCMEDYFRQSDQLDACIRLDSSFKANNGSSYWIASGMMIQRLPQQGGKPVELVYDKHDKALSDDNDERALYVEPNEWEHASILFQTLTHDEMTDGHLSPEGLVYRLYHDDGVRIFNPQPVIAKCRCSRERICSVLCSMPNEEIEPLYIDDVINVKCEFCSKNELFTRTEVMDIKHH